MSMIADVYASFREVDNRTFENLAWDNRYIRENEPLIITFTLRELLLGSEHGVTQPFLGVGFNSNPVSA